MKGFALEKILYLGRPGMPRLKSSSPNQIVLKHFKVLLQLDLIKLIFRNTHAANRLTGIYKIEYLIILYIRQSQRRHSFIQSKAISVLEQFLACQVYTGQQCPSCLLEAKWDRRVSSGDDSKSILTISSVILALN